MSRITDKLQVSGKHALVNKANSSIVIAISLSVVIIIFCAVAAQSLIQKMSYQNKVIHLKQTGANQLKKNFQNASELDKAYRAFDSATESVIGTSDKNSKIVLDALPSKYDYPALATSVLEIVKGSGTTLVSISGTDNEVTAEQTSLNPQPIEVPIEISATGNFASIQKLVADLQRSIRPFQVVSLRFNGTDAALQVTISAKTYYQPEKKIDTEQKVVPGDGAKKKTAASSSTKTTSSTGVKQ